MAQKGKNNSKTDKKSKIVHKRAKNVSSLDRSVALLTLLPVIITFVCFLPSLSNEFVNWDDDKNFLENPLIQYLTDANFWANTKAIFTSGVIGNYNPLSIWTFALEKQFFGFDQPLYWHLDNVLLHLICVFLVYRIVIFLGLSKKAAFITALLFGIHPMRVESVAWVTERKDVLFGAFYLGAILQYIKFKLDGKNIRWIWIIVLFILSLFSKIQAVSLPLSLLAVDYYMDNKSSLGSFIKSVIQKLPLFLLSAIFGILGIIMLRNYGSLATVEDATNFNFIQRLFVGAYSFTIYLVKAVIPYRMSPLYPYPATFPAYYYPAILIVPATLYLLYRTYKDEKKEIFFGMAFFIVNIIFLLQVLGAGQGYLADRFTYMAYFGLFFITGFYIDKILAKNQEKGKRVWYILISVILIIGYGILTYKQIGIWKNSGTLWTHVLKYYDKSTLPFGNRANYYRDLGKYNEALADYDRTLSLKDNQPQAYNSRARLYFELARERDTLLLALNDYNKAIELLPNDGEFWVNRGATYARLGEVDKAIENLTEGLRLKPDHAVGYMNRSIMYHNLGQTDLALKDIESYLKLVPTNGDLWYEKGRALRMLNRPEEAIAAYTEALKQITNNKGLVFYERSKTNFALNRIEDAKLDFQQCLQYGFNNIDPVYKENLGF